MVKSSSKQRIANRHVRVIKPRLLVVDRLLPLLLPLPLPLPLLPPALFLRLCSYFEERSKTK